jgi:hypothetical protein
MRGSINAWEERVDVNNVLGVQPRVLRTYLNVQTAGSKAVFVPPPPPKKNNPTTKDENKIETDSAECFVVYYEQ